jgi:hypothetical protein
VFSDILRFTCTKYRVFGHRDAWCRFHSIGRMAYFVFDVATNSVATFGVGFPTSCAMPSRVLSSLNMASFGCFAMIGVATFDFGLSQSWHMASRCFWVCVATLIFSSPTSCQMLSRGSSAPNVASFCGVSLSTSCLMASRGFSWPGFESESSLHARRRYSGVVSDRIPTLVFAKYGVLRRRRVAWRRDAARRFSSVVFCGFPEFMLAKMETWVGVVSIRVSLLASSFPGVMKLESPSRRQVPRHFASVLFCGFPRLMYIIYGILSRRRDGRCCGARHRITRVLSCVFTKLMYAIYGIFCRRLDARSRFVSIVSYGVSMLLLAWSVFEVGVAAIGVATLNAGSIMSCRRASRGSSTICIWNLLSASRQ